MAVPQDLQEFVDRFNAAGGYVRTADADRLRLGNAMLHTYPVDGYACGLWVEYYPYRTDGGVPPGDPRVEWVEGYSFPDDYIMLAECFGGGPLEFEHYLPDFDEPGKADVETWREACKRDEVKRAREIASERARYLLAHKLSEDDE
jgi:hypothetical protein